ncbi:ABC transporter ATP-binding protein [Aquibium sp. A9E412]|uniref:ABC transporter ATP-binding protein n=1 Tax=Aquibium sp. A9E412 TaxID=2976767 RepID=UPI0025B144E4|nr:ABC transporter ATP-binding protein [Aquibium sp. A9E412]MDN2568595.1 ABC transporter ATP-binding protein [Aquibium sp. A9E412]
MSSVLETRGLTMSFGGVTAVDNVDFKLARRELRCLIGPNGAGKSTFFKCLTGQLKPTAGEVLIQDEETTGCDPQAIARLGVGVKTQVPSVMDGLSVRENIWLAAYRTHGRQGARAAVDGALERLALTDIARALVGQLSHGERQRVELGIVIAAEPWLILLDEPAAGMTAEEVERMAAIIGELNRDAAIIIVEHDMQFIRSIASLVTVFAQGRILMEGPVEAVMQDRRVRDVYLGKKT